MKYINVNLLRAVIKEHTLFYAGQANLLDGTNALDGYDEVLAIIDSLQQEQDIIVINKKDWEAQEQFRKNKDFGKAIQQEQLEADLEADIEMEWDSFNKHLAKYGNESEEVVWLNWNSFNDVARYFYKLGFNARKVE